ncbi:dockerin type I repeat-containing protein [Candidatus Saccharibacteria bacterium]|nr:dockerin type I repeat-containing protein [Candidatus Saccharibacteria bacterium]
MKKLKQKLIGATLAVVVLTLAFCSGMTAFAVGSIAVSTNSLNIAIGGDATFTISATNAAGRIDIVSNDTDVATVSDDSVFLDSNLENEGEATITVTAEGAGNTTITVTLTDVVTFDEEQLSPSTTYTVNVTVGPEIEEDSVLEAVTDGILLLNSGDFSDVESRVNTGSAVATISHLRSDMSEADSDAVKTGDVLRVAIGGVNYDYTLAFLGDVDGNALVNSADYIKVRKHIMDIETITENTVTWFAADINKNDTITSADYIKIRLYIMDGTGEWRP